MTAPGAAFRAFISYSHRDQAVGRWLHRALETYRVPQRLVGRETATGLIAKRLGAIFRDRDELPVASDLTGKINDALAATQFLIVLCSPASAQSKWVNQEVINFKRLKGADSIICVIVDGEPFASNMPGREADECFCPALRSQVTPDGTLTDFPAEPIAADLRPDKDGKRLVKLKVIAGLLGVGLDELVRRENARRARQMFWLAMGSIAATVVMGVLTVNAVTARNDAERQKTHAEDLIEFMLGDLRQKLEPVGRLDVLDSVGERALKYFETLRPDELDASTLGRRARTLHLIGEMQDQRSELEKSRASFKQAADTTAELLARDPKNRDRLFEHVQSLLYLAYSDRETGDLKGAEDTFRERKRFAAVLLALDPTSIKARAESAEAEGDLGDILLRLGRGGDAAGILSEALAEKAKIAEQEPNNVSRRESLAWTRDSLADAYYDIGDLERSGLERKAELDLFRSLLEIDPENRTYQQRTMVATRSIGLVDLDRGDATMALKRFREAANGIRALVAHDPANTTWLEYLGRFELDVAAALYDQHEYSACTENLVRVENIVAELMNKDTPKIKWQLLIQTRARVLEARVLLARKDFEKLYERTTNLLQVLSQDEAALKSDRAYAGFRGKALVLRGQALAQLGRSAQARELWIEALPWLRQGRAYYIYETKMFEADALLKLGRVEEARQLLSDTDMRQFRRPDVLKLRELVGGTSRSTATAEGRKT